MDGLFVAYYRVSTPKQGETGLGLEAQRHAVADYLNGGSWELIAEFTEVESTRKARPKLEEAIRHCQLTGAKLVIAKLDRGARDVSFLDVLDKARVDFVACDLPGANPVTLGIMLVIAKGERDAISARTKAALAVVKRKLANGEEHVSKRSGRPVTRLGNPNGIKAPRRDLGVQAVKDRADEFALTVAPTIKSLRAADLSLYAIADRLNQMRVKTARGSTWTATAVKRVLARAV